MILESMQSLKQLFEKDLPNQYKVLLDELALAGWYIDYGLALPTLAELLLLDYHNKTYLDSYLTKYYKTKIKGLSKNIVSSYPTRKNILEAAFKAHSNKIYELSIPIMLGQIDGICYDLIEKDLFSKGRRKKNESIPSNIPQHWVEELQIDNFRISFLEPLRNNKYLAANFDESREYPHALNRNKILHGRDLEYANEKNSYKAISLLNYITTIVTDIKRNDGSMTWI